MTKLSKKTTPDDLHVLQDDWLVALANCGVVQYFPENSLLIREGDDASSIFIVLAGRMKVFGTAENGREFVYNTLSAGEFFGEMCLDGGLRSASVMTLAASTCVLVSRDDLRQFMATHPDFAFNLVNKLIKRVRVVTEQIKSLALDDVYHRLLHFLESSVHFEGGRRVVSESFTQQEIADRIGATREMINRIFRHLKSSGVLQLDGRKIILLKDLPERW